MKLLKFLVSFFLIGLLLFNVEWGQISSHLGVLDAWAVGIAFLFLAIQFPISTVKWKKSLEIHELQYSFGFLQKVLCIGFFFNNFLPTTIGGDGYRAIKTMPSDGFKSRAVSALLLERIIGFAALLFMGLTGALFTLREEQPAIVVYYVLACMLIFTVAVALLLLIRRGTFDRLQERLKQIKKLEVLTHNLNYLGRGRRKIAEIIGVSLVFQLIAIAIIYVLFDSVGVEGVFAKCAVIGAIAGLVSLLPISINGIGVVEGGFAVAAVELGIDFNQAVLVAFMLRILVVPFSLICGLIYLAEMRHS